MPLGGNASSHVHLMAFRSAIQLQRLGSQVVRDDNGDAPSCSGVRQIRKLLLAFLGKAFSCVFRERWCIDEVHIRRVTVDDIARHRQLECIREIALYDDCVASRTFAKRSDALFGQRRRMGGPIPGHVEIALCGVP